MTKRRKQRDYRLVVKATGKPYKPDTLPPLPLTRARRVYQDWLLAPYFGADVPVLELRPVRS